MEYDRILTPTDGSDPSKLGIERAVDLARRFDATLHALYVVDERDRPGDWDIVVERQEAEGEAALDDAGERGAAGGIDVQKHLRRGAAAEEIIGFVEEADVDLIVMGTAGRSGVGRLLHAGSTTERVIRETAVPVFAVPPNRER